MKRLTFIAAFFMLFQVAFAGGLLTNTNQSAQFIRMMSRNASTDIDAVYFNPAGLIHLGDGWHFAVHNQTIFQTKTIDSKFPLLNDGYYEGVVNVPAFPTAFAVYKDDNWAFSLGFGPNGGGGSATFDRGLPSFEIPISKVVPGLSQQGLPVTGYSADLSFEGSSIFWGIQLGATYQVNDMFSVYGGVRYLPAKNSYIGSIENVQVNVSGEMRNASGYLNELAGAAQAGANMPQTLQPIIDQGGGSFTLAQLEDAGYINANQRVAVEGGLVLSGVPPEQIGSMDLNSVYSVYVQASPVFQAQADQLSENAQNLEDREVDTEQTGAGITPMIGVEIAPNENWNIALKYEMQTILELENKTTIDEMGLFPDGAKSRSDLPAILAAGVGYRNDRLEAQLSYNMYFNKGVDWGKNTRDIAAGHPTVRDREIDSNGMEIGLGLQYNVTDVFAFSLGGLWGDMGVAESYQSDFSYSNPSVTAGAGVEWLISDQLILDAGFSNTFYQDQTVSFTDPDVGPYNETLGKSTMTFAVGLSYAIF